MDELFAGLDISTQGAKLVILDWTNLTESYVDSINYDNDLPWYGTVNGVIKGNKLGVSESNPLMWIEAVELLFKRAVDKQVPLKDIKAISVSGQQHGLVALDKKGNLAHPVSKLWNDFSTQEECDLLTQQVGGIDQMISEVGNTQRTGYTASKIYHLVRHEKENYKKADILFLVHNYINWYLTGGVAVLEPGDTSGMALWNPVTRSWSKKVLDSISADLMTKLPDMGSSTKSIGRVSNKLVDCFGFAPECKVDAGSGDNMLGAIGTGNVELGVVTISLGTSGTAYTFMDDLFVDPDGEIACFCDSTGNYLPLLCVSNMANGYNDFLSTNSLSHTQFDELISITPPGNQGKLLIPWFDGERTPDIPLATPLYFGFRTGDFDNKIIARSLLEGHVLNLHSGFDRLPVTPKIIHLTGGISRSFSWCQAIADIFHCETVPVKGEGAAMGAALHAAWVWFNEDGQNIDIRDVSNSFIKFREKSRCWPRKEYKSTYRTLKDLYRSLTKRIQGLESSDPFQIRQDLLPK